MKWYKSCNTLIDDPKLRLCSFKSNVPHYVTVVTLHSLLERCSKNGCAEFAQSDNVADEISYQCSLDTDNVKRALNGLQSFGIISGFSIVNWEKHQSDSNAERQRRFREKQKNVTLCNVTPVTVTQRRGEEIREEEKKESPRASAFVIPDWVDKSAWDEFMQIRKKLKAVNSPRALSGIINKLSKIKDSGNSPNEAIEASIRNSWKDVYEPKPSFGKVAQQKAKAGLVVGTEEWKKETGRI